MPEITYSITGILYDEFNSPFPNAKVSIYEVDLRSEKMLATTPTNAVGRYVISFKSTAADPEYKAPDVRLKVLSDAGKLLGRSPVFFNINTETVINYRLGDTPVTEINEYDRLLALLSPLVEEAKLELHQLEENDKHQDISFLSGETGEAFENIKALADAHKLFVESKMESSKAEPAQLYALLRNGFSNDLNSILQTTSDAISKAITQAVADNIVSSRLFKSLPLFVRTLNELAVEQLPKSSNLKAFATVAKTAIPNETHQKNLLAAWYESEEEPDKFWERLKTKDGFKTGKTLENTQKLFALNSLVSGQPELTASIFTSLQSGNKVKELSTLAAYTKMDWEKAISDANMTAFPATVKGESDEEKKANYAASLESVFQTIYPTPHFAARLKADTASSFANKTQLDKFFVNNPDFDLTAFDFPKALEAANFSGITKKEETIDSLKTIARLQKLAGNHYGIVNVLNKKGFRSAASIANSYGRKKFIREFAQTAGGESAAREIYTKATSIAKRTTALIAAYKTRYDVDIYAMDGNTKKDEAHAAFWKGYHEMFSDGELCDCEHCQSVYSPAAYFVDMLAFLRKEDETAFEKLIARRPDLEYIMLTCENTNTVLPYIDLVNELLEREVLLSDASLSNNEREVIRNTSLQTASTAELLDAMPEHAQPEAYEFLKQINENSAFSNVLPFDEPFEQRKQYLDKLGWNHYDLLKTFNGNDTATKYNDPVLAKAWFGASPTHWKLVSGETPLPTSLQEDLSLRSLLGIMKISYITLCRLLETYFLNPENGDTRALAIEIIETGETEDDGQTVLLSCNLDKLTVKGIDEAWLSKAARFIRLWKITGWDLFDLDRAFTAFGIQDFPNVDEFDESLLLPLYHTGLLAQEFKKDISTALVFLYRINKNTYHDWTREGQPRIRSHYEELFENPFLVDAASLSIPEKLAAAFETSISEINDLEIDLSDLNIDTASRVYRNILLSKKLNLPVSEILELFEITGRDLSTTSDWRVSGILQLLDEAAIVRASGLMPSKLPALLQKKEGEIHVYDISDAFVEFIRNQIDHFDEISLIESQTDRAERQSGQVEELISRFADSIEWLAGKEAVGSADKVLKKWIETFTTEDNHASMRLWSPTETITKLQGLHHAVETYRNTGSKPAMVNQLGFSNEKIAWLRRNKVATETEALWNDSSVENLRDIYPAYRNLVYLSRIAKTANKDQDWTEIFGTTTTDQDGYFQLLARQFGFLQNSLEIVSEKLGFEFPLDCSDPSKIFELINAAKEFSQLKASATQLDALLTLEPDAGAAGSVLSLLKSRYNASDWPKTIKPVNDQLREKRRDALVAWLLAGKVEWNSEGDLYKHLLIDIEMDACMDTSRIKQAISSVQLFITRCLMGLEEGITLDDDFARQWNEWRKLYRVWEANRKIFLYPENWIEPELRDDKSPFFEELESQLKQNEVTDETAEEALLTYLEKLDTVARLEIVGLFNDEETGILHVFGRTFNVPHQYWYRSQYKNIWSAWEKVELDIEGDHILPVVWNGRLMLFWGQFAEKQEESDGFIVPEAGDTIANPSKYFEMKLAWSEYKNGRWGGKRMSKDSISFNTEAWSNYRIAKENVILTSKIREGRLLIVPFVPVISDVKFLLEVSGFFDSFEFDNCNSSPQLRVIPGFLWRTPNTIEMNNIVCYNVTEHEFYLQDNGIYQRSASQRNNTLFRKVLNNTKITPSHHEVETKGREPFFYSDEENVFFVRQVSDVSTRLFETNSMNWNSHNLSVEIPKKTHIVAHVGVLSKRLDLNKLIPNATKISKSKYLFRSFVYSKSCSLMKNIKERGISEIYTDETQNQIPKNFFTSTEYVPTNSIKLPYPSDGFEFSICSSYSQYNWELFFHIPISIASQLMQNQRYEEARKWLHYIFNPAAAGNEAEGAKRFWVTKPFREELENPVSLEELLTNEAHVEELAAQLDYWEDHPFNPHAVARLRVSAYMRKTVMLYVDNLLKWGDQLFTKDTLESINEATLLYVLAKEILGERQEKVSARANPEPASFAQIKNMLDAFSNVNTDEIEHFIAPGNSGDDNLKMLYFGLPKNDQLLKYWDTVEDRLFKIRNCMNIEGVVRSLALFEPPIDPALLVRAAAAGLSIGDVFDASVTLPNYRFQVMLQKANELCSDVKSLGSLLLSAMEKRDAEALSLLRSTHELNMLIVIKRMKEMQRDEAEESLRGLIVSKDLIENRKDYFTNRIDRNQWENLNYNLLMAANSLETVLSINATLASLQSLIPQTNIGPWIMGSTFGGLNLFNATNVALEGGSLLASTLKNGANMANFYGSEIRRKEESQYQVASAELELKQIDKQIAAAEILLAIAEQDLANHNLQTEQSQQVDEYMRSKFTNVELYSWMMGQVSTVYFQSYDLAYKTAKKAELCMNYELGKETALIKFGYWDNLKQGLLSGERLQYGLRQLENAYLENNIREFEISKHISISQLDPFALIQLRSTGYCEFEIPEVLYDLDFSGQYFRRLKSVSISLPCIAGPYTSINATLTLKTSRYRKDKSIGTIGYVETDTTGDTRFVRDFGNGTKSIATSHAQNDSGMFELNFRDERYLPFEGCGAISTWSLELPTAVKQFDNSSISDVIMHVRYTARDGGLELKEAANLDLTGRLAAIRQGLENTGLHVAISMRRDMPNEWGMLKKTKTTWVTISRDRLPYFARESSGTVESIVFFTVNTAVSLTVDTQVVEINKALVDVELVEVENEIFYSESESDNLAFDSSVKLAIDSQDELDTVQDLLLVVKVKIGV